MTNLGSQHEPSVKSIVGDTRLARSDADDIQWDLNFCIVVNTRTELFMAKEGLKWSSQACQ